MTRDPNDGGEAASILNEAANIVVGVRGQTHGDKERSFDLIGYFWTAYLNGRAGRASAAITAFDVAQMMVLLKIARSIQGTAARDHFVDAAGYSGIAGEIAAANPRPAVPPAEDMRERHEELVSGVLVQQREAHEKRAEALKAADADSIRKTAYDEALVALKDYAVLLLESKRAAVGAAPNPFRAAVSAMLDHIAKRRACGPDVYEG